MKYSFASVPTPNTVIAQSLLFRQCYSIFYNLKVWKKERQRQRDFWNQSVHRSWLKEKGTFDISSHALQSASNISFTILIKQSLVHFNTTRKCKACTFMAFEPTSVSKAKTSYYIQRHLVYLDDFCRLLQSTQITSFKIICYMTANSELENRIEFLEILITFI